MVRFNLLCTNIDPIGSGKLFVLSTVTVNEGDESQMRLSYFKCLVFTHYRTPGTKPCFGVLNLFVCVQDGYLLVLSAVLITKEIMVFKNHAFQAKISGLQHWPSVLVRCIILCFCIMVLIFCYTGLIVSLSSPSGSDICSQACVSDEAVSRCHP